MIPLDFKKASGLITTVVQDATTKQVLMVAYMNAESLEKTMTTGETWFWSRSRNMLWHKGETSGNTQTVQAIAVDCDADTLLITVNPAGPACHTGATPVVFIVSIQKGRAPNDSCQTKHYRII